MKILYRLMCAGMALGASLAFAAEDIVKDGGPYVPTPQIVVDAMLAIAGVGPRDFVVDLGSGDGRIVSHDFDFGEWKPDRSVDVQTPEKYEITGSWTSTVHLWTVPAAVEGAWLGSLAGERGGPFRLEVKQRYQHFEGRLVRDAQVSVLRDAQIDGARIRFSAPGADGRLEIFTGTVQDGRITGEARAGNATAAVRWSAVRVP